MHYNPLKYVKTDTDILSFVNCYIMNTNGDGKAGDPFWENSEKMLYTSLIALLRDWFPPEDYNLSSLLTLLSMAEARENDENFKSPLDLLFLQIEEGKRYIPNEGGAPAPSMGISGLSRNFGTGNATGDSDWSWEPTNLKRNSDGVRPADCGGLSPDEDFALMNYKNFKVAAGKTLKSIIISCNDVIDRLGGETKDIVVFEVMSKNAVADEEGSAPVIVASECDLDSEEQTVNLVPTVIGTTATDKSDGDHTLMAGKDAVITDRVTYEGLIPGKEYTLKATLMDKKTGEMLSINDQHVTAELKFTPNSQNGTIDIDLGKFDASSLDGHDLVVFEELYKQTEQGNEATEVLVAEHKDIDDEGQTVTVTTTPPGGFFGKTGGNDFFIVVSIAALAVLACGCAYYGIKNSRAAKAEDAAADEGGDTDNGDVSGDSEA